MKTCLEARPLHKAHGSNLLNQMSGNERYGTNGGSVESTPSVKSNGYNRSGATVCLLDDDPSVLKATGRLLRAEGLEVETFTSPHAFLEHAEKEQPPVAVIDVLMPEMNGLEVQMRLRDLAPSTRVIVLTSKDDPLVRTKAIEGGASAFLLKPADDEEFLSRIRSALHGDAGGGSARCCAA